jgi:Na+/H+-dicarboxylate symporter
VKEIKYYKATAGSRNNMNVLGLIVFCGVFGYCLASMGENAKVLLKCIDTLNNSVLKMIQLVM